MAMEELLKSVAEAEELAASKKAEAQAQAAEIAERARLCASEIIDNMDADIRSYRESALKEAELRVKEKTQKTLADASASAAAEAEAILADTRLTVSAIVRRVTDGDSRHA